MIIAIAMLAVNNAATFMMFPRRRGLFVTIGFCVLYTVALFAVIYYTGFLSGNYGAISAGLLYLPPMLWFFKGALFQKMFGFFLNFLLTFLQFTFSEEIARFVVGDDGFYVLWLVLTLTMLAAYVFLLFKFGRRFFDRLFAYGRQLEWAVYSFGVIFSFAIVTVYRANHNSAGQYISLLLFIFWSIGVLCFAIINTHEKSKQRYEAEFARNIVSSGRDHYQKMDELRDELRTMRHDYQYHLSAARQMLRSGEVTAADDFLSGVETRLFASELPNFCANTVINALIADYAERCSKLDIKYDIKIALPEPLTVSNYDMCIMLGNLLENAVEACAKLEDGRLIQVIINSRETQLALMVKNSFDGSIAQDAGQLISSKQEGGLGIKSIRAVAMRYGGDMITEWDAESFTAIVYMRL